MKKRIILLIILLSIFMIGAVSASSDTNNTADSKLTNNAQKHNNKEIVKKDVVSKSKKDITHERSFNDLQLKDGQTKRIDYLPRYGSIDLDYDVSYQSGDGTINIPNYQDLTINGNGHTIDAKNKIRIFGVGTGAILTLKNVNIMGGFVSGGSGGAILNKGTIKLTNCTFTNCKVSGSESEGGAICGAGSATIVNCTFNQCSAGDKGGAIRGEKLTIKSCTFKKCSAQNMGGTIFGNKNKISACNFNECNAGYGGAIGGTPHSIVDSTFKNCEATESSNYDGGGACFGDFPRIESCKFINCKAPNAFGGAVRGTVNIYNCEFMDCVAKQGGAIRGKGDITACTFENCKATADRGGGIFTEKSIINECTFIKCSAKTYGGGIYAGQKVTVSNSKFKQNTALLGNDIYSDNENIKINNCTFNEKNTVYWEGKEVKKVTPKLYAKGKSFNVKTKVKKYAIILKDNQNKAMKSKLVTLKVNGKTYQAKTNNKGQAIFKINKLNKKGQYTATINYQGDENYNKATQKVKIIVNKETTKLTATPLKLTTIYNINKKLVIVLKDKQNKPLTYTQITVKLGTNTKKYTTNKKGQIQISTKKLTPKTYIAQIIFNGNNNYLKSSTKTKISIKKATPKITANAKTFKEGVEIKKYGIILNNNIKQSMKKVTVALNVNGKNYKVRTNNKGVAIFTINNLNKKGTYAATITYKGDKNYNKVSKKVKLTIK